MPLVIHPRIRKTVMRLAATTSVAMFATTGAALADGGSLLSSSSCTAPAVTSPFAQLGDSASYFGVPGGTFEGSATQVGWSLNNAALTAGNEPFYVNSRSDGQSLTVSSDGSAQSPFFCIDSTMPYFRFVTRQVAPGSDLQVQIVARFGDYTPSLTVSTLPDGSVPSWTAIQQIALTHGIPIPVGNSVQAALRFRVRDGGGAWQIDDVYVDPYRLG